MRKNSEVGLFLFDIFGSKDYVQLGECFTKIEELGFQFRNIRCENGAVSIIVVYGKVIMGKGLVPIDFNEWEVKTPYISEETLSKKSFQEVYELLSLNNDYMDNQTKWRQMEGIDTVSSEI